MIKYDAPLDLGENVNMRFLVERIKPNSRILEFGPSTGRLTKYLKECLHCEVYIVEIDQEAFEIANKYAFNGLCADIEDYSWIEMVSEKLFDYIIFADVLEHLRNPLKVITMLRDYLNPTGSILVSIPNIAHNAVLLQLLNQRFDYQKTGLLDNTHVHFFTQETCKEMFEEAGYSMVECSGTFAEPYDTELHMNYDGIPESVIQYLSSRDYANLYQIMYRFTLNESTDKNNILAKKKCRELLAKIFFDYGDGFKEEDSIYLTLNNQSKLQILNIHFDETRTIKKIALNPLDNFWSKSSIVKFLSGSQYINDYYVDGYFIKDGKYNVIQNQKYIWNIDKEVNNVYIEYECELIYMDEVLNGYIKQTQTLNYKANSARETQNELMHELNNKNHEISECYSLMNISNKFMMEQFQNILLTLGEQENSSKLKKMFLKKKPLEIKKYDFTLFSPINYEDKNIIVSSVESFTAIYSADYALLTFNNVKLKDIYFAKISSLIHNVIALYTDSYHINSNEISFKTDFSLDYILNNDCEYDALIIHTKVLKLLTFYYDINNITNSRNLMIALATITDRIIHVPFIGYETSYMCAEMNFDQNETLHRFLIQKYYDKATIINNEIRYTYIRNEPKVTIIIPTKDGVDLLRDCVKSILEKSTYKNYEILILNNNSEITATFKWFDEIQNKYENVKVIDALFEFNWSKLNNFGISNCDDSDVYIFLNNDTVVKSPDWIERLSENSLRPDVGVVGALLLYDDETIQHAGVVIGMTDFADHIYKAEEVNYHSDCFIDPSAKRNVLAVTGACMAISSDTIKKIGLFNDEFIICGSDVEICLRAYKMGLLNVYEPAAVLYHLESKSRDSYIPEIDFIMSQKYYEPYKSEGDPYFNQNLNKKVTTPERR